jgi:hypothetical protein
MTTLDFAKSVPNGEGRYIGSNHISRQSIQHHFRTVTVLMTITVSTLLLAAKRGDDILQ